MSFNKLNVLFDDLQDQINDCQSDVTKFVYGKTGYSYNQIQAILNDNEGEWYIEDTTTDI